MMIFKHITFQYLKNKTFVLCLLLLISVIFLLYGQTIKHQYAIDDNLVTQNHSIVQKGLKGIPEIFTSYYFIDRKMQFGYRPIVMLSFAVEHQFFGQNPHVSHFVNILLYIVNCMLIFLVLRKLFSKENIYFPFLVTLIFAVHPIHTEVVCSIKSRDELLSFAFSFTALYLALLYVDTKKIYLAPIIIVVYVLAIFSKQTAYTFLAVIPLCLFIYQKKIEAKKQFIIISALIAGIIIASVPRYLLPPVEREIFYFENPLVLDGGIINRLSAALYIIPFYIKLFLYPHPLVFYYGYNMIPILSIYHPLIILSFIASLFVFIFALFQIKKNPVIAFSILYFYITISMFLNIVEPVAGIVAERFAYFPSLGFCLLIAYGIFRLLKVDPEKYDKNLKKTKLIFLTSLVLLIPYSVKTYSRAKDWENHSVLYAKDIKHMENSALGNAIYAELLINEIFNDISQNKRPKDFEKKLNLAVKHYVRSFIIYTDYFSSYNNLAFIYYQFYKDYGKAIPLLEKAIKLRPDYTEAYFNLGYCHQMLYQTNEAEAYYYKTLKLDSTFIQAYSYLGEICLIKNDTSKAIDLNKKIIEIAPESDMPYVNMGKIYLSLGDTLLSMQNFEKAAEKSPQNTDLLNQLAVFYEFKGNIEKATYFKKKLTEQNNNRNK